MRSPNNTYRDRLTGFHHSFRTGNIVCSCGRGYGSDFDGKCYRCRGGQTAWDVRRQAAAAAFRLSKWSGNL